MLSLHFTLKNFLGNPAGAGASRDTAPSDKRALPISARSYIPVRITFRVKILGITNLFALSRENEGVCTIYFNNVLSRDSPDSDNEAEQ